MSVPSQIPFPNALHSPSDPASVLNALRAVYQTRLLVAATHHLEVFEQFAAGAQTLESLQSRLGLAERPARVLFPALCALGLLRRDAAAKLDLTEAGRALVRAHEPNLLGYLTFSADEPEVLEMAERLRYDGPRVKSETGTAYVKEGDGPSPMDDPATARELTLRLAGRARTLGPLTARVLPKAVGPMHLVDVAAGSGYYSYEWLLANPKGTATVFDRPAVLQIAKECLEAFCREKGAEATRGLRERVAFHPGDMLADEIPQADVLLAFSLLHDWPAETCALLTKRFAAALNPGGEMWVHDEFLDETLDGPLQAALYSAQLFWVTAGRIYSRGEHAGWCAAAGLTVTEARNPTALNYSLFCARKS